MIHAGLRRFRIKASARHDEARRFRALPESKFENGIPCWNRTSLLMAVRKHFCKLPPELLGQRDDNEARSGTYSGKKRFNSGVVMTRSTNVNVPLFRAS